MRADRAVEPTRSENITVTWRRSARSSGCVLGALDVVAASMERVLPRASLRRAAMASSSFTRWPKDATPSSLRSSAVRFGRTVSSMSFSRKTASYLPRPKLRSQTTMSMTALKHIGSVADDTLIKVRQHARVLCGYRLPITLLIRAHQLCIGQHVALHCSLDLRFCRAS